MTPDEIGKLFPTEPPSGTVIIGYINMTTPTTPRIIIYKRLDAYDAWGIPGSDTEFKWNDIVISGIGNPRFHLLDVIYTSEIGDAL